MTVNDTDPGRRPRRPLVQSMGLAIELWLRTDHLVEPEDASDAERSADLASI